MDEEDLAEGGRPRSGSRGHVFGALLVTLLGLTLTVASWGFPVKDALSGAETPMTVEDMNELLLSGPCILAMGVVFLVAPHWAGEPGAWQRSPGEWSREQKASVAIGLGAGALNLALFHLSVQTGVFWRLFGR